MELLNQWSTPICREHLFDIHGFVHENKFYFLIFFKIGLDKRLTKWYNMQVRKAYDLGVAQLVARYLGVVEAASSSLVTQTISSVHNRFQLWTLDIFMSAFIFCCLE